MKNRTLLLLAAAFVLPRWARAVPPLPKLDKMTSLAEDAAFQFGKREKAPEGATAGQTPLSRYVIPVAEGDFINRKVTAYKLGPSASPAPYWFGFVGSKSFLTRYLMLSGEKTAPVFIPLPSLKNPSDIAKLAWNMTVGSGFPIDVPGVGLYHLSVKGLSTMDPAQMEISLLPKDKSQVSYSGLKADALVRDIASQMTPKLFTFTSAGQKVSLFYSLDVNASGKDFESKGTFLFLREKSGGYDAWAFAEVDQAFPEGHAEDIQLEASGVPTVPLRVERRGQELLIFSR